MDTKARPSLFCYSCPCTDDDDYDNNKLHVSISAWLKSELPEIKERCANLFSGRIGKHRHRGNSVEFRYDPLSYALNFDDDSRLDEFPLRNFSSRLPPSPPPSSDNKNSVVVVSRQLSARS